MNERRKIVIQTGSDAEDEQLPTPHFDAEATLTARPVVPLAEGGQAFAPRRTWKSWNPLLLVLIILGAIGLGVATGLAIGFYRNRQTATPAVASESSRPATENMGARQPVEQPSPTPQAQASVPEAVEESSVQPAAEDDERAERSARDQRDDADDKDKKDEKATPPPVVRENQRPREDDEAVYDVDLEARRAERQRRREERRERRRQRQQDEQTINVPREVERAGREINRIRDIFEGRQP